MPRHKLEVLLSFANAMRAAALAGLWSGDAWARARDIICAVGVHMLVRESRAMSNQLLQTVLAL